MHSSPSPPQRPQEGWASVWRTSSQDLSSGQLLQQRGQSGNLPAWDERAKAVLGRVTEALGRPFLSLRLSERERWPHCCYLTRGSSLSMTEAPPPWGEGGALRPGRRPGRPLSAHCPHTFLPGVESSPPRTPVSPSLPPLLVLTPRGPCLHPCPLTPVPRTLTLLLFSAGCWEASGFLGLVTTDLGSGEFPHRPCSGPVLPLCLRPRPRWATGSVSSSSK